MARPASRYFVPVIRKISELKKAENIRIDQQFKADLLGELMMRAGLGEVGVRKPEREVLDRREEAMAADLPESTTEGFKDGNLGSEAGSFKDGNPVLDFFNKWKYQMALVPVAFVLVLVAMQSFRMPVKMEGETVVPTAERTTEEPTGGQTAESAFMEEGSQEQAEILLLEEPAVESGADSEEAPVDAEKLLSTMFPQLNVTVEDEVDPEAEKVRRAEEEGTAVPATEEKAIDATPFMAQHAEMTVPAEMTKDDSNKKPGIAAGDLPPELAGDLQEDALTTRTQSGEGIVMPEEPAVYEPATDTVSAPVVAPAPVTVTAPVPPAPVLYREPVVPVDAVVPLEGSVPEVSDSLDVMVLRTDVYYDSSFTADKIIFEEKVLDKLMGDGGYDYASVTRESDGTVTVTLSGKDGLPIKKTYRLNTRTGAWDEVIYVQEYYFDDTLIYERSPVYYPYFSR